MSGVDHPCLLSPATDDQDSVLDLSLKKRPRLDSCEDSFLFSPSSSSCKRRAGGAVGGGGVGGGGDSGDEYCGSQDEYHSDGSGLRPDGSGSGTYKKHLLKRYCEWVVRVGVCVCVCVGGGGG